MNKRNRLKLGLKLITAWVGITVLCGTLNAVTITVQSEEKQQMRYGLDYERLWFWYGTQTSKDQCAQWSVVDCDVDYLRVAINSGYELVEGTYNLSAYTNKIIPMMTTMKAANPNIKFFASPRPLDEALDGARWQPYPYWITGDPGDGSSFNFNWQKCAQYLVRYVNLMKSYGFKIDYMDLTNEWNYVKPDHAQYIRDYMITELGDDMPLLIAPSAWSFWQGYLWLNSAQNNYKMTDGFDIAACHNTGYQGTPADFADKALEIGKEAWDSEVHGWKGKVTVDEISTSHQMFDRISAGFSGLNSWLAIGTTSQQHCYFLNKGTNTGIVRNVKYYIFKKLTTTSNYGHALDVNLPTEFTSTAALIRGNLLTIWVLNNSSVDVPNVEFVVNDQIISDTPIKSTQWHSSLSIVGQSDSITKSSSSDAQFQSTINANSLYCFEVSLDLSAPNGALQAHYAFDGNTDDSSDFLRHGIAVNGEVYATGIIDQAMSFGGVDDYVVANSVCTTLAGKDVTISAWVKAPALNPNQQFMISINTSSGDNKLLFGTQPNTATPSLYDIEWHTTAATVIDNTWHHVAYVFDDSSDTITVYVDGDNVLSFTSTVSLADSDILSLGQEYDAGLIASDFYAGLIDDVRIYDSTLDSYEIAGLYFLGRPDSEICLLEENDLQYDYTDDCQVDLSDAAVLSSQWLLSTDITDLAGLASEWLMTDLFSASMLETIFETFDSNPYSNGWVNAQSGNTTFTYNATGYIDAEIYRDSANTARFYKALYRNYDQTDEFWFEYDAQIVSATSLLQRALAGLFNLSASDNDHDLLAARFAYWEYSGNPRRNRHDLYCYATDGTEAYIPGSPLEPGIAYGQNIRVKIHYWYESGLGKASLDIYEINTDGSTGPLIMAVPTSTVVGPGKNLILNSMGLGNRTDGTDSGENNVVKIDNMYFSPEAENPSPTSPSF